MVPDSYLQYLNLKYFSIKNEACILIEFLKLLNEKIKHALSDKAKKVKFDPEIASKQECLITTFQECYHESDSFQEAKEKMRFLFD